MPPKELPPHLGGIHESAAELDLDVMRAVFPDWRFGGTPGYWFAVRGGIETASGPRSLPRRCLSAGTIEALADKLCLQGYLDGLNDQVLADVWQHVSLPKPSRTAS